MENDLRREFVLGNVPIIAADVSSASCGVLCAADPGWMTSAEAWKALLHPTGSSSLSSLSSHGGGGERDESATASLLGSVGTSLRDAVLAKRAAGWRYVVLYAVRDERPFLLKLPPPAQALGA